MRPPTDWLVRLARLRCDRARGQPAPHKPLLLLSILAGIDDGEQLPLLFPLTPELAFRFLALGSVVADRQRQRIDVRLPFHHLQSDGVWDALNRDGDPSAEYRRTTTASLNPTFAAFVADDRNRENAKLVLIREYFRPAEQVALRELLNLPPDVVTPTTTDGIPLVIEEAVRQGREARFRLRVLAAYNYTCALTGYRLTTITGASVVDAAHIHQFADSRNNDLRNGMALSKTAHWLFDQGLWTLTDDFKVIIACNAFTESGPDSWRIKQHHDRPLLHLPSDSTTWPDPVHLAWHRRSVFESG